LQNTNTDSDEDLDLDLESGLGFGNIGSGFPPVGFSQLAELRLGEAAS